MVELRDGYIRALNTRPKRLRATMLEVTLIDQINDTIECAEELAAFVKVMIEQVPDVKLVINLIPWNDIGIDSMLYKKPRMDRVYSFQKILIERGLYAFIRTTRGDDESAACGQLTTKRKKKSERKRDFITSTN